MFQKDCLLSFLYLNSRSPSNKIDLLQYYVNDVKPRIIAITETWAKPEMPGGMCATAG